MLWVPLKDVAQNCVSLSVLQELVAVVKQLLVTNSILTLWAFYNHGSVQKMCAFYKHLIKVCVSPS